MEVSRLLRWPLAGLGLLVGCGFAVWMVLLVSLRSSATHVPNVIGVDAVHASALVQQSGLVARLQGGVFDPNVPAGRIAIQRPEVGFQAKRGAIVLLYPSLGKAVQKVGDLTGFPVSLAEAELENEHLSVDRRCEVDGQADAVVVLAQMPAAGTLVAPNSSVTLLVNRTPRTRRWVMPDFVGAAEPDASRVIRALGFQLATVQPVSYPGLAEGTVLRQDPPAGGPVGTAAVIGLWVAR